MAGKKLFGRVCRLTIKPKQGDSFKIEGFDFAFDVEKNTKPEPNKAEFTVFNLPDDVRAKLQLKDDAEIEFEAGYKTTAALVFKGNISHAIHYIDGPDMVTKIEAGEGHKAFRSSYVAKTYGAGTPFKTVVNDIVKTFEGFKVTPAITKVLSNIGKSFPDGITIDGKSARVLNDVLKGVGYEFSIQNNEIQILAQGVGASDAPAVKLDYTSGLVGIPQLGEKQGTPTLSFQSLVQPGLVPGRKVLVDWEGNGGKQVVVQEVKIKGSNFDTEYYSVCESRVP